MRQHGRFWWTGGVATVLAAASQPVAARQGARISRISPFTLGDTVNRLEQEAFTCGLPVFARLAAPPKPGADPLAGWVARLLVLSTPDAQTPVLLTADGAIELPLALRVERGTGGGTEVQFSDSQWLAAQAELPGELLEQLAVLPALVSQALAEA